MSGFRFDPEYRAAHGAICRLSTAEIERRIPAAEGTMEEIAINDELEQRELAAEDARHGAYAPS